MRAAWMGDLFQGLKYGQLTAKEAYASDVMILSIQAGVKIEDLPMYLSMMCSMYVNFDTQIIV